MLTVLKDKELSDEVSKEVTEITEEVKNFCIDLCMAMRIEGGIGISAPQVGRMERIIVLDTITFDSSGHQCCIMINPEIIDHTGQQTINEGCLSFPGRKRRVKRYKKVHVKYQNTQGHTLECWFQGLAAQVIMHEIDHLNGITFVDEGGYKL